MNNNGELVLEPDEVRLTVSLAISNFWACQYALLDYIDNDAFSNVMNSISINKLALVVKDLPDGKSAGLFGILNELWKHYGVLMNTCSIALIKMAKKILSKIFSDRIFFACSKFGVLCGNNFSVLKDTSIQSPVFTVRSVVEDALKKNKELWLVLQDIYKAYNSVGWHYLRINTKFVAKTGRIKNSSGMIFFFVAGAFVDNMIWVGDCQTSMQYALNIAMAIPINQGVRVVSLSISSQPISIAKKEKAYRYLGIFLSTNELSKPSLAKAHLDIRFFVNVVFRKTITDKQFFYLVSAVLQPIMSYRTQFNFVLSEVCYKWNVMVKKGLKSKACLSCDFSSEALYYFSLYSLKSFKQVQSESKVAAVVSFLNAPGILGILAFEQFAKMHSSLFEIWSGSFGVYTNGLLKLTGSTNIVSNAATYFSALDMRISVGVCGLLSSTMAKLQTVALFLKCVPSSSSVVLHLDSQAVIDACVSEVSFDVLDFCNQCWIEKMHIFNLIQDKDLFVYWVKIKDHSEISGNTRADILASEVAGSSFVLPTRMCEHFLMAENFVVSGNAYYFVRDIFHSICHA
ncbi:hypothetical protein G9A89_017365 [Geosiphon pyriformis]|nr:hypothetical protein G9A89_017365 [Geosiphon pyriformis]